MDQVEDIKSRLSIYDVVSSYVSLKKAGKNFKGLCPFHQEKTPSFIVSPDKGICYCFGCKNGGDIFEFIKGVEGVDFKGALELLADRAGVTLRKDPQYKKIQSEKDTTKNIYRTVNNYYQEKLNENKKVYDYFIERGLNEQTIKGFELGFAPDSYDQTHTYLIKEGFQRKEIVEAGLAIQKEVAKDHVYDRFRNRAMFPLKNTQGNIIAFAGRIIDTGEPKYLNSPETVLYKKGRYLYGLFEAKESIRKNEKVLIVEGNMDVLRSHQAGLQNVVASSGTALTVDQIKMLKRYASHFVFCFDSDGAGFEATKRAVEIALHEEVQISVLPLPEGIKDPDDFIQKCGAQTWCDYSNESVYFIDFLIDHTMLSIPDPRSVDGKRKLCAEVFPFLAQIRSAVTQDHYLRLCAQKMGNVGTDTLLKELQRYRKSGNTPSAQPKKVSLSASKGAQYSFEERLLGAFLNYPQFVSEVMPSLDIEAYSDIKTEKFYKELKSRYNQSGEIDIKEYAKSFSSEEQDYLSIVALYMDEWFDTTPEDKVLEFLKKTVQQINDRNFKPYILKLQQEGKMELVQQYIAKRKR